MVINDKTSFGILGVAPDLVPITPNNDTNLPTPARAIRCRGDGASGTLRITTQSGQVRNTYIAAGETLLVAAFRVHVAGTTATGLEAYV